MLFKGLLVSQAVVSPPITPRRVIDHERIAWGVMLIAFAIFCVLLTLAVLTAHYFLFQSTTPLQASIRVSRGTVTVTGTDMRGLSVQSRREVVGSSVLATDAQSQAMLFVTDPRDANVTTAIITLRPGSQLNLRQAVRPRFEWSSAQYWINLTGARGSFDIFVPPDLGRDIMVTVQTDNNATMHLSASGRYSMIATAQQVELVNHSGTAVLLLPDETMQPAARGQRVIWNSNDTPIMTAPALVNLLGDTTFSPQNVVDYNAGGTATRTLMWRCNNIQNEFPPSPMGGYNLTVADGRPALHLARGVGAQSHGETLCVQGFGANGLDVSIYNHVSIRVTFKIVGHSLSACGIEGSECPLMVRLQYNPVSGGSPVEWVHGFFAYFNPSVENRLRCDSCTEYHEIVNVGEWYTYESDNFRVGSLPAETPASILNVRFYASGHDYDVYVSELALLVDQAQIPLPLVAPTNAGSGS